jgi:hypothetical protein
MGKGFLMFGASNFLRPKHSNANDHGFDCAYLGLDKHNPYPPGSIDHKQWEWGWNEGMDMLGELEAVPIHPFSNEYGNEEIGI